jgi:magnesium chelatase family protein
MGVEGRLVRVEVDVAFGLQVFQVVGLPDGAVRESRLRVPAALEQAGLRFPQERVTVNLAPADMRKDGSAFDLPIALGVLLASEWAGRTKQDLDGYLVAGELGLTGEVRPVRGILPLAVLARDQGKRGVIVPWENSAEARAVSGVEVIAVRHLRELECWVMGRGAPALEASVPVEVAADGYDEDFSEVAGQQEVRRALEVAAAGGHNILMIGPPGAGKSMLARRVPTILPPLEEEEALEATKIYSVAGQLEGGGLLRRRAYRCPHHTISDVGLVGGGSGMPRPGELSLAHHGVLFLDELPEFKRNVLEVLRQPLEEGRVTINRSLMTLTYPAQAMVVAAMNPCKCGYHGSEHLRRCTCASEQIKRYRDRISGPLLDRLDLHVGVEAVGYGALREAGGAEGSAAMRARVTRAREVQRKRFAGRGIRLNAQMRTTELREFCGLDEASHRLLERVVDGMGMSARACDRIVKVARTIADLEGEVRIRAPHVAEAIQYRRLDRRGAA